VQCLIFLQIVLHSSRTHQFRWGPRLTEARTLPSSLTVRCLTCFTVYTSRITSLVLWCTHRASEEILVHTAPPRLPPPQRAVSEVLTVYTPIRDTSSPGLHYFTRQCSLSFARWRNEPVPYSHTLWIPYMAYHEAYSTGSIIANGDIAMCTRTYSFNEYKCTQHSSNDVSHLPADL
jgi:hypothetical protein